MVILVDEFLNLFVGQLFTLALDDKVKGYDIVGTILLVEILLHLVVMLVRELAGVSPSVLTLDGTVHVMRLVLPLMRYQEGGLVHQVVCVIQHVMLRHLIGLILLIGYLLLSMIDLKFLIKVVLNVLDLAVTLALCARVVILLVNTHYELASVSALGYKLPAIGVRDQKHAWVALVPGCTAKHEEDIRIRHD